MNEMENKPLVTVPFKNCQVLLYSHEYLETVFPLGKTPALFTIDLETRHTARHCGYEDTAYGVRRMHLDHEICHTFLSEELGRPYSYVLYRVASGVPWTFDQTRSDEEAIVLAFQRYMNTLEKFHAQYDSILDCLTDPFGLTRVYKACYSYIYQYLKI